MRTCIFAVLMLLYLPQSGANAATGGQKGLGDTTGVAQKSEKPATTSLSGEVVEVKVGPCEHTSGQSDTGFHLILKTVEGKTINLHVGPADALKDVRDRISIGESLDADVFRTEDMPADAYVAKTLTLGDEVFTIRDDDLRPAWATSRSKKQGRRSGKGRKQGGG